jgi:hypothetical protein
VKDFGVEQDFRQYLERNRDLVTSSPDRADWHYLPVYWTRWHLNHEYGKSGVETLEKEIDNVILNDSKTFTICQYVDGTLVDLGQATVFLASRKTERGRDIPLISSPHRIPFFKPSKKYVASFVGRLSTHPIRQEMAERLQNRDDVYIYDGVMKSKSVIVRALEKYVPLWSKRESRFFVKIMLESYIALCPRGYGGSSFRFFEAMQLEVVPFLIGDIDVRPFKSLVPWNELSLFASSARDIGDVLDALQWDELVSMGHKVARFYRENLAYQKWCRYVIQELSDR